MNIVRETPGLSILAVLPASPDGQPGSAYPVPLTAEEQAVWVSCFRSPFGPKQALVDELRVEKRLDDATLVVSYDEHRVEFYPGGRIVMSLDRSPIPASMRR